MPETCRDAFCRFLSATAGYSPQTTQCWLKIYNSRFVGNPEAMPPIFRKIQAAAVGRTGRSVPVLFQFAEPDVAVADWVVVVLQREREFFRSGGVRRPHVVAGRAGQLDVVLDQHAVVECGDVRWA